MSLSSGAADDNTKLDGRRHDRRALLASLDQADTQCPARTSVVPPRLLPPAHAHARVSPPHVRRTRPRGVVSGVVSGVVEEVELEQQQQHQVAGRHPAEQLTADSPGGSKTQAPGQEYPHDPDFDSVEWKALLAYEAHAGCPKGLRLCVKQIPTKDGAVNYEEWASLYDKGRPDGQPSELPKGDGRPPRRRWKLGDARPLPGGAAQGCRGPLQRATVATVATYAARAAAFGR